MRLLYQFFILLFSIGAKVSVLFSQKSVKFISGRKHWKDNLRKGMNNIQNPIWIHCSSLGEFEQGRPVIEALRNRGEKILLTFFSPSGYEYKKDYNGVDFVSYLPIDSKSNALAFLEIVKPKAVMFIKYEFWFNHIIEVEKKSIPIFLISGIFREEHYFFKFYGKWFADKLRKFSYFFVQNEDSEQLLKGLSIQNITVTGDTRFDRVIEGAINPEKLEILEAFTRSELCILAGSTWESDEILINQLLDDDFFHGKLIIAPHDVNETRLQHLENTFSGNTVRYSNFKKNDQDKNILIIDEIGILSGAYQYGDIAIIGGGFGSGIHNTLEAAVFGLPILFGPNYLNFEEAKEMVSAQSAFSFSTFEELKQFISPIISDASLRKNLGQKNKEYVLSKAGATTKIIDKLVELGIF